MNIHASNFQSDESGIPTLASVSSAVETGPAPSSRIPFGIVIVSFNTRELSLECLRSVKRCAPEASVVVVDNGSRDGSVAAVSSEFPEVSLLPLPKNVGFGRANTLGLCLLSEATVVLLNSDTILTADALQRCVQQLADNEVLGAVTPRLKGIDGAWQNVHHAVPTFRQTLSRALWRRPMMSTEDDFWIPGTCMVLKRDAVNSAGGLFDPALFIYWEDADLCSRLKAAGYELDVVDDAQITHVGGASGGGPNCTAKSGLHEWYTFGRHFWYRAHRPRWEAAALWLLEFLDAFRCMGRALVRPSRRQEFQYGTTLLKTLLRQLAGMSPTFAVPDLHGRVDADLIHLYGGETCEDSPPSSVTQANADIGVVIIGRNEGERLERCLKSVATQNLPFVYVDSGSTDGSQQLAVDLGATLVELGVSSPFTAARARNAGFERLMSENRNLHLVQFLDGDCELSANWLPAAQKFLGDDPECAIVCGVLQERQPERSVYNRLCQLEWRRPTGMIASCGGIFLARTEALIQSGGFDSTLIAGEEPELCVRLRAQQWNIQAVADSMASHDAAMTKFAQWWNRTIRGGFGYAQSYAMHGHRPERFRRREVRSILFYGLLAPLAAIAAAWPTAGGSLAVLALIFFRLYCKVRAGRIEQGEFMADAGLYARYVVLGKFAQAIGVIRFHLNRLLGRTNRIIEYKQAAGCQQRSEPS